MKMKRLAGFILLAGLLLGTQGVASAQDSNTEGLPMDVYYLMPSFQTGMIFFYGQGPAQGQLNICALDQTLRFLDKNGKELAASDEDSIVKVQIDTVTFMRSREAYYRLYPVTLDAGVALLREVTILDDVKTGAYGTVSQTSSIRQHKVIYADGVAYELNKQDYPYKVSETLYLFKGNSVVALNKKNLRKLFPDKKTELDAWFEAGNSLPETVQEALDLLK